MFPWTAPGWLWGWSTWGRSAVDQTVDQKCLWTSNLEIPRLLKSLESWACRVPVVGNDPEPEMAWGTIFPRVTHGNPMISNGFVKIPSGAVDLQPQTIISIHLCRTWIG